MVITRAFNIHFYSVLVLGKKPLRISKIYKSQKTFHDPVDSFLGYHDDVPYCKHCKYEFAIGNSSKRHYSARRHVRAHVSNGKIILAEQLPETAVRRSASSRIFPIENRKRKKTATTRMKTIEDLNLSIFAVLKCGLEFKLYRQTVTLHFCGSVFWSFPRSLL